MAINLGRFVFSFVPAVFLFAPTVLPGQDTVYGAATIRIEPVIKMGEPVYSAVRPGAEPNEYEMLAELELSANCNWGMEAVGGNVEWLLDKDDPLIADSSVVRGGPGRGIKLRAVFSWISRRGAQSLPLKEVGFVIAPD